MKKNDKNLMNTGESSLGGGIKKKLQKDITPYLVFAIPQIGRASCRERV